MALHPVQIVGLAIGEDVVPLSLACAMPGMFDDQVLTVLTSGKTKNLWRQALMHQPAIAASPEQPRITAAGADSPDMDGAPWALVRFSFVFLRSLFSSPQ